MMNVFTIQFVDDRRVEIRRGAEEIPFWTYDFKGTMSPEEAKEKAIRVLRERGERIAETRSANRKRLKKLMVITEPVG